MLSRRSFLAMSSLAVSSAVFGPKSAEAIQNPLVTCGARNYIEKVNESGETWVTMALDKEGQLVVIEEYDSLTETDMYGMARSGTAVSIAVFVGSALAGYVIGTVVDGIVISATGQSGAAWVSQAINMLVGRPVPASKSIRLSCNVYPPNSMEYIRCTRS